MNYLFYFYAKCKKYYFFYKLNYLKTDFKDLSKVILCYYILEVAQLVKK